MRLLMTEQEILNMLGLNDIKYVRSVDLRLRPNELPEVVVIYCPSKETKDWLSIMNSGISHWKLMQMIRSENECN